MGKRTSHSAGADCGRRSFMAGTAGAGLCAAVSPFLNLFGSTPANAANWRGLVGCVKPRADSSSLVELIRLLPEGIGIVPVYLDFAYGTREELSNSYGNYERTSLILPPNIAT